MYVALDGPTGEPWVWGPETAVNRVEGPALDFCLVVTQRRHVDDTALATQGDVAQRVDDDRAGVRRAARRRSSPRTVRRARAVRPVSIANCSGLLRRPARRAARDARRPVTRRRAHRRLPRRAHDAHPLEGPAARSRCRVRAHVPHADGGSARHLPRPRSEDRHERGRAQPACTRRPAAASSGSASGHAAGRGGRRRRHPRPDPGAAATRRAVRAPRPRRLARRRRREAGDRQRVSRRLGDRGRARRGRRRRGVRPRHRRRPHRRAGRVVARLGTRRLGRARRGRGRGPRDRVRPAGDGWQLSVPRRARARLARLPDRRSRGRRLVRDHEATRHRRRRDDRDRHRTVAVRDRRAAYANPDVVARFDTITLDADRPRSCADQRRAR